MYTKKEILDYLKEHKEDFSKKYSVTQIGLFGSYARDEQTENSDIDIFVEMKPKLFLLSSLKSEIEDYFKVKVDIIRNHKNLNPFFLKKVEKDIRYA